MTDRNHRLPPEKVSVDPSPEIEALKHVAIELTGKIQLLVEFLDSQGLLEDHCFVFPDGDLWKAGDSELPKK